MEIIRIILGILIALLGIFNIFNNEVICKILIIIAYIILLFKTSKTAIKQLIKDRELDESMLITISCIGAYLIGKQVEGLMVIILYEIGEILEDKAVGKSRNAISELMKIKPDYANLKQGETYKKVKPEEVQIGDIIIVKTYVVSKRQNNSVA